jgi:hypothetical protein
VAVPFYIPISSAEGFEVLYILYNTCFHSVPLIIVILVSVCDISLWF